MVADAAFLRPAERAAIEAAATAAAVPFTGLWLTAPIAVLEAQIAARHAAGLRKPAQRDASDADAAVLAAAAARDAGQVAWHEVDASADPIPAARALLCGEGLH